MAEGGDPKLSQSKINSPNAPSTSFTPLRSYEELCVADENLPSKDIAQLWQRPLKLANSQTHSNPSSPNTTSQNVRRRSKNQPRRNIFPWPSTKLVFQPGESPEFKENATAKTFRFGTRRSMSFPETGASTETPVFKPKRFKLFNEEISPYEDLLNSKPTALKDSNGSSSLTPCVRKLILKSQSDSGLLSTSIKTALEKIESDPNLIGDATSAYILPIKKDGKHQDLKEITAETLSNLIETKEDCAGITFKVIDCRYPYEFEGGHIRGALNLFSKRRIEDELMECKTTLNDPNMADSQKVNKGREILIFHCEFSSHRGPSLCRYLRDIDRTSNASSYPFLFYPELYVLYGGYKDFYEQFPNLCDPSAYVPMTDPQHAEEYRRYKSLSKLGFGAY